MQQTYDSYGTLGGVGGANMYGTKPPKVVRLIVQTTGTYNDQYRRPYSSNLVGEHGAQVMHNLTDLMGRSKQLTSQNFVLPDTNFVTQNATPENNVGIFGGWNQPRLRFMLELYCEDNMGNVTHMYIYGHTDFADVSYAGNFDPRMKFHINSMNTTRTSTISGGFGQLKMHNIVDSSHLLVNRNFDNAFSGSQIYTQAPEAIFSNWQNISFNEAGGMEASFVDTRVHLTGQPVKSNRANAIAPLYSKTILDTYLQQTRSGEEQESLLANCASAVASDEVFRDAFLSHLYEVRKRQFGGMVTNFDDSFTFEDLCAIDPEAVTKVEPVTFVDGQHTAGATAAWHGSDRWTQTAALLAQSLPAYLSRNGFAFAKLMSTNIGTIGGEPVTVVSGFNGYNNHLDQTNAVTALIYQLDHELFRSISLGGQIGYRAEMQVATAGETWIKLSLNGEPEMMYVLPSFADAMMTPIVTLNKSNLDGITGSLDQLTTNLWENGDPSLRGLSMSGDMHL